MGKQQMETDMKIQKMLLCSALLLAVGFSAGCGSSQASSQVSLPNIRPGVKFEAATVNGSIQGGLVKEVRGNWVLVAQESGEAEWTNFDNLGAYRVLSK